MSRTKLLTLGIIALLVVSGASASTASAVFVLSETACTGGTFVDLCWAKTAEGELKELTGSQALTLVKDEGKVLLKVPGAGFEVECEKLSGSGEVLQASPLAEDMKIDGAVITFEKCTVIGTFATKCDVPENKATKALAGTPETAAGKLSEEILLLKPEVGTVFIEFEVTSLPGQTCALAGTAKVEGTQECKWVQPLVDLAVHLLHCEPSGSKLKTLGLESTFEALTEVKLPGLEDLWDIEEVA